jgi:hypothetical protein
MAGALTLTWAVPALAGDSPDRPPVQRPSVRAAEPEKPTPGEVEAEPVEAVAPEPAPVEATPELAPVEAAPEQLDVAPPAADAGALPSYADTGFTGAHPPLALDQPGPVQREVPRDGRGMLVIGSLGVAGGAGLGAGTVALAVSGYASDIWVPTLVLSVGATLAGSLFLFGGRRRLLRYRDWASKQGDTIPRQGNGLVAGGASLLCAGAGLGMFGTIGWLMSNVGFQDGDSTTSPVFPAMVGVGLGSLAAGTVVIILGMKRHRHFQAWRQHGGNLALLPVIAPMPGGGGQIGLAGRF